MKIKPSLYIGDIKGKSKNSYAHHFKNRIVVSVIANQHHKDNVRKKQIRNNVTTCSREWANLYKVERQAWKNWAVEKKKYKQTDDGKFDSGYSAFMSENLKHLANGEPIEPLPPYSDQLPTVFEVGEVYWTIDANFDPMSEWAGTWEKLPDGILYASSSENIECGYIAPTTQHNHQYGLAADIQNMSLANTLYIETEDEFYEIGEEVEDVEKDLETPTSEDGDYEYAWMYKNEAAYSQKKELEVKHFPRIVIVGWRRVR